MEASNQFPDYFTWCKVKWFCLLFICVQWGRFIISINFINAIDMNWRFQEAFIDVEN